MFLLSILMLTACLSQAAHTAPISADKSSAVILAYQRIGEDAYPDTSIRLDQFLAHIEELENNDYNIIPLSELIHALKMQKALPSKTIAITFEGAYRSALKYAFPLLISKNIPFSVFYASNHATSDTQQHMNWSELKAIHKSGLVDIGILPASYERLYDQPEENIRAQINQALMQYRENFNANPDFFAYPFGEYSLNYKQTIEKFEFEAAFGLHSGVSWYGSDFMAIPRFTMTENYGDIERFKLVTHALPLPVSQITPAETLLEKQPPIISFTLDEKLQKDQKQLSCFISGQPKPEIKFYDQNKIDIISHGTLDEKRTRLNCTMPGYHSEQDVIRWRWFGLLFTRKDTNPQ